jgi:glycine hydroxymethyltransferase
VGGGGEIGARTCHKTCTCEITCHSSSFLCRATAALTTRGFVEADFEKVASFLHRAMGIALDIQATSGSKTVVDFVSAFKGRADIAALRADVNAFATSFPMPGFDVSSMKYSGKSGRS